jgi:hypothetical protein
LAPDSRARPKKELYTGLVATGIRAFANWWYENQRVPREVVVDAILDFASSAATNLSRERGSARR